MKYGFILLGWLIMAPVASAAPLPCNADMIGVVDSSGNYVHMASGQNFRVYPGQNVKALFWEPLDKVQVCALGGAAVKITNPAQAARNSQVLALRQFN